MFIIRNIGVSPPVSRLRGLKASYGFLNFANFWQFSCYILRKFAFGRGPSRFLKFSAKYKPVSYRKTKHARVMNIISLVPVCLCPVEKLVKAQVTDFSSFLFPYSGYPFSFVFGLTFLNSIIGIGGHVCRP